MGGGGQKRDDEVGRRGLMFVLSSPSGAGKTTLSRRLLAADPAIYEPIGRETAGRTLLRSEVIPVRTGRAWIAPAGSVVRFTIIDSPSRPAYCAAVGITKVDRAGIEPAT